LPYSGDFKLESRAITSGIQMKVSAMISISAALNAKRMPPICHANPMQRTASALAAIRSGVTFTSAE